MSDDNNSIGIPAHYFSGFMQEVFSSLLLAKRLMSMPDETHNGTDGVLEREATATIGFHVRHAFLVCVTALEAAANGLIASISDNRKSIIEDLEKLATVTKFEIFAIAHGKHIERSSDKFEKIKKWIKCRNDFVHPKPCRVDITIRDDGHEFDIKVKKCGNRDYPLAFDFIEFRHSVWFAEDLLSFVAWVVFDTCGFSIKDGAQLIGANTVFHSADAFKVRHEFGFDTRSVGIDSLDA